QFERRFASGLQERLQKSCVAQLVVGVVSDVLRHIAIQIMKRQGVSRISSDEPLEFLSRLGGPTARGPDSPEFRVLDPQITLDKFCPEGELQNCGVASTKPVVARTDLCTAFRRE